MGTMRALIEQLTESTVTFKVTPKSLRKGFERSTSLARATPSEEISAELINGFRKGEYQLIIMDDEDVPNYSENESSFSRKFYAESDEEAVREATKLVQQYLRDHPPGWYQKELADRYKKSGQYNDDVTGRSR